jgi:hypothetical protein
MYTLRIFGEPLVQVEYLNYMVLPYTFSYFQLVVG